MKIRIRNKKLVFGILAVAIAFTMVASAGLLTLYGKVETTATVEQSVVLWDADANDWVDYQTSVGEDFDVSGGCCECFAHNILNRACVEAPIDIDTSIDAYGKGPEGVDVYYREGEFQVLPHSNQNQDNKDAETLPYIEWEIIGNEIEFTFVNPFTWDYYFDYRVDGESGNDWAYTYETITQGECAGQLWGQYYNVVKVDAGSQETVTVTGCEEIQVGLRMGPEQQHYIDWIIFELPELDNPFTLQPGEQLDFLIQYCFDIAIKPGAYKITTEFSPAD